MTKDGLLEPGDIIERKTWDGEISRFRIGLVGEHIPLGSLKGALESLLGDEAEGAEGDS